MKKIAQKTRGQNRLDHPARGSRTGRPVMLLLDLLGRRTALRILWELYGKGPLTFRALQAASETNPSVLNTRLAELREMHIVANGEAGYELTSLGQELIGLLLPLHVWSERWAKAVGRAQGR